MKSAQAKSKEAPSSNAETVKTDSAQAKSGQIPVQRPKNNTGLPDNLKAGIENLSGHSMDDVKVHYNSAQPAQLNAHAYAQGTDIHVAPGQEKHVPHEAWHVVQQKQGRVKATRQLKGETGLNDDAALEKEADIMGGRALSATGESFAQLVHKGVSAPAVQRTPSTFWVHSKAASMLLSGEGPKSKGFRAWVKEYDPLKVFNTKWADLQDALKAYTDLPDTPVTPEHQKLILNVEEKVEAWRLEHKTKQKEEKGELNDDQEAKLLVVKDIEKALPEEIQYARTPGRSKPKTEGGIVGARLEFMFKDALGEDLIDVHSQRLWDYVESNLPTFDGMFLKKKQVPENKEAYAEISNKKLLWLAFARAQKVGKNFDAKNKVSIASAQLTKMSRIAERGLIFGDEVSELAQRILVEIIDEKVRPSYPDLVDGIIREVETHGVNGLGIEEFYETAGNSFVESKDVPNNLRELSGGKLEKLKKAIKTSPEYALFCNIAKAYGTGNITGKDLPPEKLRQGKKGGKQKQLEDSDDEEYEEEDLAQRENELLHSLQFEGEEHAKNGDKLKEKQPVSTVNKQRLVLAVMTIEKITGRRLPKYPTFIVVKKPGGYRANADSESRFIRYDENFEMRTAVHELGHYFENQSQLQDWYLVYLLIRSRHRQHAERLGKNSDLIYESSLPQAKGEPGFLGGLKGLEHRYYQEYTSKYYRSGHTEMLSMFTERFISQEKIDSVLEQDPQGFAILMKILRPGALPDWHFGKLGYEKK